MEAVMVETPSNGVAGAFLADMFGASTHAPVYLSSLPNGDAPPGEPGERHIATRLPDQIERFLRKWDRPGRAAYFCTATIQPSKTRSKDTLAELNGLHADIDFRSVLASPEEVEQKLGQLRLLPTAVVNSGNGLHCYWLFREALPATSDTISYIENLLRLLADHVGGDPACCEASRLLRLPGSHNSKGGAWTEVAIVADRPARYDPDELEEWLTEVSPFIHRKPKENGDAPDTEVNPWLTVAARFGIKPPIDVEQRLAAMQFQGAGDAAIHPTQLAVSASLLTHGSGIDEVVTTLLDATRAAAGQFGERWNWQREEHAVRKMCESWLAKHPEFHEQQAEQSAEQPAEESDQQQDGRRQEQQQDRATGTAGTARERVIDLAQARAKKKQKTGAAGAQADVIAALAAGTIEAVRQQGRDLLLAGGDLHIYEGGIWRVAQPHDEQNLKVGLQTGARTLGKAAKMGLLSAAWKLLCEHPDLYRRDVAWDRCGIVAVANGVLDLRSRAFSDWRADLYLRHKRDVAYVAGAECPRFIDFLLSMFGDRGEDERAETVALLQEFTGACLAVPLLHREQRRALFLVGPSYTGKTEFANMIARLVGEPIATTSVAALGERFGLAPFHDARAWVRDDAINPGDHLDPQRFKLIVTGEPIDIDRKHCAATRGVRLAIPVVLTANTLPRARDFSDAIFNRCLVVPTGNVISQEAAAESMRSHGVREGGRLTDLLFEQEGPGVLNWALDGLDRLRARGLYAIPQHIKAAIDAFKTDENPVCDWARVAIKRSPLTKIDRKDLVCAFNGWWSEEKGEKDPLRTGHWLVPKLRDACPYARDVKTDGIRYIGGIELTEEGRAFWSRQNGADKGPKGKAATANAVNQSWDSERAPGRVT
jgi:P4 family phage/plasmid primase-like protien